MTMDVAPMKAMMLPIIWHSKVSAQLISPGAEAAGRKSSEGIDEKAAGLYVVCMSIYVYVYILY